MLEGSLESISHGELHALLLCLVQHDNKSNLVAAIFKAAGLGFGGDDGSPSDLSSTLQVVICFKSASMHG